MENISIPAAAAVTASVSVVIWVATRLFDWIKDWRATRRENRNYIRALYAEIDFNTYDMELFQSQSASIKAVVDKVRSVQDFIPHITDARHTDIYRSDVSKITYVNNDLTGQLVCFYGFLEKLKTQIDGIHLKSFILISADGREATIREIFKTVQDCATLGRTILGVMELEYSALPLRRTPRDVPQTDRNTTNLEERRLQFLSDLDRVRTAHQNSPLSHPTR
ncbi:hypothetical protein [Pannonibacter sp.]|uniref:hypothetical protein n=1 Tax=Pannonibacter sp. TaxID=1906786 RepID=UPI003F7058B8